MEKKIALAALLFLFGGTAARADILFFDDLNSQINVYYAVGSTLDLTHDLIYSTTSESVQMQPGVPVSNLVLPSNVNIYSSGLLTDMLQFVKTPAGTNTYNVSIDFTSAAPGTTLTPLSPGVTMNANGQIQDAGIAHGSYGGSTYSVDVQFRIAPTGVPEPSIPGLLLGALPALGLLKRGLAA